ncbi:MAG: type 3 dihydrofolate reductase [Candidatus Sungbacteria bacterium]|nr:type 3 dihydrofolate reductase [Candidatus Sungbacteria bacterium]
MTISLIAAMDKNRVIGKKGALPWYLPADLRHFKELTTGKPIIMGSATYASIGKALPNRINIVMTHDKEFRAEGCVIVHSIEAALAATQGHDEVMIIGGANIFAQFLPLAHKMYLTMIDTEIDGDVYFPKWNPNEWHEISREAREPDEKNKYTYTFITLEKQ